ncbi:MAG TPA: hypothetical protein VMT22_21435, partial [Terriglobales bacterium]|nr:hypothetical protein [Terriglobales bacterium]
MKAKIFESLRLAFFRALSGAVGIWCILGPIVLLNASGFISWELATVLGFLLILCYSVVLVICVRAKWDALKELVSETTLAMCFMIVGLLANEITGIFIAIKDKLVIVYAFVGFLIAELIKPTALGNLLGGIKRKQTTDPIAADTGKERSAGPPSAGLIDQNDKRTQAIATLSARPTATPKTSGEYGTDPSPLLNAESQQLHKKIEYGKGLDMSEIPLEQWKTRIQEAVALSATLQIELAAVKQQLVEREDALEMLRTATQSAAKIQSENQQIRMENQGLQEVLTSYRIQLEARETRFQALARRNQEVTDRYERLEAEVADLNRRLKESQSNDREIETARQQLANVESQAMLYWTQQQHSEARIVELEGELANVKKQLQAHEDTRQRLREAERVCQRLAKENRLLKAEFPIWQERLAAAEEGQRQVRSLWHKIHRLQTEHARLVNKERPAREEFADSGEPRLISGFKETRVVAKTLYTGSRDSLMQSPHENEENAKSNCIFWMAIKRQWRFGAVAAAVVMVAASVMLGVLETKFSVRKEVVVAPEASFQEYKVAAVAEPEKKPAHETSFPEYFVEAVSNARKKSAPRVQGTFETVRPTQVYDGPSENSAWIADIGAGMRLKVVGSSFGWLEIRSMHGRPPGFVRQEAAVSIARN